MGQEGRGLQSKRCETERVKNSTELKAGAKDRREVADQRLPRMCCEQWSAEPQLGTTEIVHNAGIWSL